MTKRVVSATYRFVLELLAGDLLLFLFYIRGDTFPPIFLLTLVGSAGFIVYSFLLGSLSNKGKWLYLVIVLPLLIFIGSWAGLSVALIFILGLYIFWRGISLSEDLPTGSPTLLLLWSFSIGIIAIIYSTMTKYTYQNQMMTMLILLVFLTIASGYFSNWGTLGTDKKIFSLFFIKAIVALIGIGAILAFTLKYIGAAFFGLLQLTAKLFSSLALPVFKVIEYLLSLIGTSAVDIKYEPVEPLKGDNSYQAPSHGFGEYIFCLLIGLAVAGFIYYVIKQKFKQHQIVINNAKTAVEITTGMTNQNPSTFYKNWGKPPEDLIRKEIFQLEKYAHKLKLGRLPNETLGEWAHRAGLSLSDDSIGIYHRVRYGDEIGSGEEISKIKTEIVLVKKQLREMKHNQKKIRKNQKQ
jgi:hypothetical protein